MLTFNRPAFVFLVILVCSSNHVTGQVRWAAEFNLGLPVNIPGPLSVNRNGNPDISILARWSAASFERPYNWMWRIGRWNRNTAWEFETIHHKMVLLNPHDPIQWLSITHGFNTLTVNKAWEKDKLILRLGAGAVLAHPESTIDSLRFNQESGLFNLGYYLTGPVFMASAARPLKPCNNFLVNLECKMTVGYANVPVVDGRASLLHLAFHLNAGLGFSVRGRKAHK